MKKLLALVLALVMSMSLVTISNAAFKDADKIEHTEAVEVMNALGVINGMPDGSFAPAGNVTRAEMAKMITIIMLGDIDAAAFKGTATDLTDINGHWAEGFIKYCYSQGVIAGRGDGTFAPNANVTAVEAAKMLLVAIGYNADVQGYVGSQWSINIIRDAQLSKFFDKLSVTSNKVLTRDEAAQMIWNAVQATMIEKTSSVGRNDGSIRDSYAPYGKRADGSTVNLLSETFGAKKQYGYLGTATYNDDNKNLYTYTIGRVAAFGAGEIATDDDGITVTTLKTANDYTALFGQRVAVVYKDSKTVYGIYSDAKVLATATVGAIKDEDGNALDDATDSTIKMGDVKVKLATTVAGAKIYAANNSTALQSGSPAADSNLYTLTGVSKYSKIAAIDNNDDGKADVFVVYPVTAQKVTYVGTASITAGGQVYNYDKETGLYKNSSIKYTFPKDIAKDDYVLVPAYGVSGVTRELTKVEKVSGKVNATKSSSAKIADVWYDKNGNSVTLGDTYDVWTVEGYMAAVKVVSSASKDVALLIADENATTLNKSQAKLMFADGKVEIVSVSKYDGTALASGEKASDSSHANGSLVLVTYKVLDDGTYDVKKVDGSNKAGYDVYTGTGTSYTEASSSSGTPAKLNGSIIADDAVIMVVSKANSDPKYSIIDGKTLKTYSTFTASQAIQALYASNNGVDTVKVATVISNSDFFGVTAAYGYVVSAPYMTKEGNTQYNNYDVWTVDGLVTIKDNNYNSTPVSAKGQVVSLQKNNNDTYTGTVVSAETVAVSGYSSTDNIITLTKTDGSVYGTANMSLKDAKVLFADTKNKTGIEGGEIAVAEKTNDGGFKANALAVYADSKLKLLIADTSNLLNGTTTECGYTMTLTNSSGATLTVTNGDGSTVAGGDKLATGSTVVITFKHNAAVKLNVTGATATWTNLDDNSTGSVGANENFGANTNWKAVVTVGSSDFTIAFSA